MPQFSDHSLPASVTLVFGRTGSGKTTLCFRYIANLLTVQKLNSALPACVFIYDWKQQAEKTFGIPAVTTVHGIHAALASRLVIFNPHPMFPGDQLVRPPEGGEKVLNDYVHGVRWFSNKVWELAQSGPGRKLIYIDELKEFQSRFYLPHELARIVRMGRAENLGLLTSTQFPRDYHADIRGNVTEWVALSCTENAELESVRQYWPGVDVAATLPGGNFVGFNRDSRATLAGKLW